MPLRATGDGVSARLREPPTKRARREPVRQDQKDRCDPRLAPPLFGPVQPRRTATVRKTPRRRRPCTQRTQYRLSPTALGLLGLGVAAALLAPALVQAGTGGTEFNSLYTLMTGWMQGTMGRLIAVATGTLGILAGMYRGSLMLGLSGIGAAVMMFFLPTIIGGIVTATLTAERVQAAIAAGAL
jgi:conjugal transfer pilus assembly protein TraA